MNGYNALIMKILKLCQNLVICLSILVCLLTLPAIGPQAAVSSLDVPPPIPASLLDKTQKSIHPFLMANQDLYRQGRDRMRHDLYNALWKEYKQRAEGYTKRTSPWYIGQGPLNKEYSFHPRALNLRDLTFYGDVLCEMMIYVGFESERWAINLLKDEVKRLLDDLSASPSVTQSPIATTRPFTPQEAYLLALVSLTYDQVYNRFDTSERHEPNNRLKNIRDQLAVFCSTTDPATLRPADRVIYGTALGLSTLLCISVYPYEWERRQSFTAQSFLPDLYRAVSLTRSGLEGMVTEDMRIQSPVTELESALLIGIPWMECMKRQGYPLITKRGMYDRIYQAIKIHRMPGTNEIIEPYLRFPLRSPWIPTTTELLWQVAPEMYEFETAPPLTARQAVVEGATDTSTGRVLPTPTPIPANKPRGLPDRLASRSSGVRATGPKKMRLDKPEIPRGPILKPIEVDMRRSSSAYNLREMLERFSFPRKETAQPLPAPQEEDSSVRAGWNKPTGLELPSIWGAVLLLAASENPSSGAFEFWDEFGGLVDSHPYTFLFQKSLRSGYRGGENYQTLLRYPELSLTVMSTEAHRLPYFFASQAASDTHPLATTTMNHESFLVNDNKNIFRWLHDIPTEGLGSSVSTQKETKSDQVIHSDLYTWWTSFSPSGETQIIRRSSRGVGGAYTLIAHFPDTQSINPPIENILFSIPTEGDGSADHLLPEWIRVQHEPPPKSTYTPPSMMSPLIVEWATSIFMSNMQNYQRMKTLQRKGALAMKPNGKLNVLFSPETILRSSRLDGVIGSMIEAKLRDPLQPFYYITAVEQSGQELFTPKYASLPLPGLRVLEWKQGMDIIGMKVGEKMDDTFLDSDADLVLVSNDHSMKGIFYIMINGTYLRVKFSPNQQAYTLLVDTKGRRLNAVWSSRKLYTSAAPGPMSVFYAPNAVGFECPGNVIEYGQKGRQVMVWGHKPKP